MSPEQSKARPLYPIEIEWNTVNLLSYTCKETCLENVTEEWIVCSAYFIWLLFIPTWAVTLERSGVLCFVMILEFILLLISID